MKRMGTLGSMLMAACASLALAAPASAKSYVIQAGHVIRDASQGLSGPSTIRVTDGRITAIEEGFQPLTEGATLIDLKTKTVMPGLIDLHTHLTGDPGGDYWREAVEPDEWGVVLGTKNARLTAKAGFTTVRDAGGAAEAIYSVRRGTAEGIIPGPRIVSAGYPLAIIGGHGDITGFRPEVNELLSSGYACTGAVDCTAKVRKASQNGADVIKITATGGVLSQQGRGLGAHFTDAEMTAIAETAHSLGLKVMAHAHGARGIEAASRSGIDTIEHSTYADTAALKVMKEHGTVLVPTLMAIQSVGEGLDKGIYTPVVEEKIRAVAGKLGDAVRQARAMGVTIAFGTDSGVFEHGRNAGEFALLMDAGMTSPEAIASATTVAAKVLDMENEIGRLAPGYSADIIALDGNPLDNAALLEKIDWVMARGRIIN